MNATERPARTGRVMILAQRQPELYQDVLVFEYVDGSLYYFHGGPTCNTSDGMVTLPEKYRDKIVYDATKARS